MDSTAPTFPPVDAIDVLRPWTDYSALSLANSFGYLLLDARTQRFTFGNHPLRFSLDEFKEITGLNCGVFDVEDSETEVNEPCSMWKQLFDTTVGEITVVQVLKMLENPYIADWKRVPLALIALVDGTTACYGFPLALQLLAFEAVPQLLARIPDADNTEDFLDNPSCCGNTVVILNTNDIVAVEREPDVIVDVSLIPEAERHFWLDEVEDPKVTRLVDHIRSGHTFRTGDFEGGDGHNEPDVSPESGRSPNEDLKSWILEQFQNFKNGIYECLDQFEKTLCDHFGVPLPNIHNKGKRKVGEDDHGYSGSPKSVENQYKKQRPNRKSRKINSTVPKPGQKMHSYPLRSTDSLEVHPIKQF
ncbi:hypothetical protein F2Q69_00021544 [Brassica cretica]|uniref:DUF1985 domain-containing protein n=1 Tax=Brassica cretica TaxID=69181 RepID=A0A8S9QLG2_BRACR|nr:hypothetical protein F2Q69_00021544 [Brassica cretica]